MAKGITSLLIQGLTKVTTGTGCEAGWSAFDGNCYKHFSEKITWQEAQNKCVGEEVRKIE